MKRRLSSSTPPSLPDGGWLKKFRRLFGFSGQTRPTMILSSPSSCSCSYSYSPQFPLHNSHSSTTQFNEFPTSLALSSLHLRRRFFYNLPPPSLKPRRVSPFPSSTGALSASTVVERLGSSPEESRDDDKNELEFASNGETERFNFDSSFDSTELRRFQSPDVEVKELDELPEQWRRSRLAWLCKELPAHNHATITRVLNAQRKWLRQDDANYVVVHCMRIRENETAFRVIFFIYHHVFSLDSVFYVSFVPFICSHFPGYPL